MIRGRRGGGGAGALASTLLVLVAFLPFLTPTHIAPTDVGIVPLTVDAHDITRVYTSILGKSQGPSTVPQPGQAPPIGVAALSFGPGLQGGGGLGVGSSALSGRYFDYVLIIVMENKGICQILTTCGGAGTYMTSLANGSGLAKNYVQCSAPSLPNYLCLTGAGDFGCAGYDGGPHSNPCTNTAWNAPNIVDRLETGGVTWKAYMEGMPSNCYANNSGLYAVRHDPFVYYDDIASNATRCARVVPSGSSNAALLQDLNSTTTASNYMWLTPDVCNDMHDCNVTVGDAFLSALVPKILNSTVFQTQRAALLITFDEKGPVSSPALYTVWAGRVAKAGFSSTAPYGHFSVLATIESNWNLPALNTNDSAAANMSEFFVGHPTARFSYSPTWPSVNRTVSFNGSASSDPDPNATLQFRWDWTNDGTWDTSWSASPTAQHAYSPASVYTAAMQVKDALGSTNTTMHQIPVDGVPPVTISILSAPLSNGWYRGNVTAKLVATDDLSGVARTNYSLDGGAWHPYLGPFLVPGEGNHTLRYYSVDNATNQEATKTRAFKKDGIAPVTTPTFTGTVLGNVFVTPINVTLTATDSGSGVAVTKYRMDSSPWTTYTGTFAVSNVGSHTVWFNSTDVAGNVEVTNSFDAVNGVVTGVVGITSQASYSGTPGSAGWYTSKVNVTLSFVNGTSPPDSIFYRLDGGAWTLYSQVFVVNGDGTHGLDFNATNNAGLNEATHHATIKIDTAPPQTTAAVSGTQGSNGWYVSNVSVSLTATDATSGVDHISYRVDGGSWQLYSAPFVLSDGNHTLEYHATDVAGLVESGHSANVKVDTAPPTTTATLQGTPGNGGWYTSNVTVSLSAADATSGVTSIFYRVDNGSWNAYSSSFTLTQGRRFLQYYSTDKSGLAESVHSTNVRIDTTPPATTAALAGTHGSNGWFISNVTVTLTATDAVSGVDHVSYRTDGGTWKVYSGPFGISEGSHILEYYATDVAGLTETVHSASVKIDTTAPVTTATLQGIIGNGGWYTSNVTVTLTATDATSGVSAISVRVDNGSWGTYSAPFTLGEGQHIVQFYATDVAGLQESTHSTSVRIDMTPPVTNAALAGTPGNGGWYVSNVTVTLTATDAGGGVAAIIYRIDNGSWTGYSTPFSIADGHHLLEYRATDVAGLVEATRSTTVSVDTSPPVTTISLSGTPGSNGWYKSNVTVSLAATDATSGLAAISYRVDNGSWGTYSSTFVLEDGRHFVQYYATDFAGNVEATRSRNVAVDTTPPATTATFVGTPGDNGWYRSNVTASLAATDATSGVAIILYQVDNGTWQTYSGPFSLANGQHTLKFYSTDFAGVVEAVHTRSVAVDTTAPVTNATLSGTVGNPGWYISNVTMSLNATDALSGLGAISYRINNGTWTTYAAPFLLTEGHHFVQYYAVDRAGNVELAKSVDVAVDTTPPATTTALSGTRGNSGWYVSNVTVTLNATDATSGVANLSYRIDNGSWTTYSVPFALGSGRHVVEYFATDRAGLAETIRSISLNIDTTPPVSLIALSGTPGSNGWYITNVTGTLTASDDLSGVANIRYRIDAGAWQIYSSPKTLTEGQHLVEWYATDVAGLVEAAHSASVAVDTTPPATAATLQGTFGNGGWYTSNVTVTLVATDATSGVAGVFYRVDGGSWAAYAGPFTMSEGAHILQYHAADVAGLVETVHSKSVSIDTTPPQTTAGFQGTAGANGWYVSNVTISLTATDATSGVAAITYRVDGQSWTTFSSPFVLSDGVHFLEYYATDVAGLAESTRSASLMIDTVPPATVATLSGTLSDNGWYVSNVTITLQTSDATSGVVNAYYAVDNGSWLVYSGPFVLTNGQHVVQYYATDLAGLAEATLSLTIKINTIAPVTTLSLAGTLGSNGWYVSDLTVTLSATDGTAGVAAISYRVDGGSWATYSGAFVLSDGVHTVEYYATDLAGNVEPRHSRTLWVDTTPPLSSAAASGTFGDNGWYVSRVTVTLAASDSTSGIASIAYRVDNGSWQTYAVPFQLADGRHFVEFFATDHAGLTSSLGSMTSAIDTTPPATTASLEGTLGDNGWYTSNVTVSLVAIDIASGTAGIMVRVDGAVWVPYSGPFVLGEGPHVVQYYATDRAGLAEAVHSQLLAADETPPVTSVAVAGTSGDAGWYVSAVTVTLNATDALSGPSSTEYRVDGGTWFVYTGPISISSGGKHTLEFASVDAAGNREALHALAVDVDATDPSFTSLTAPEGFMTSPIRLTWTAVDNDSGIAGYAVSVDGGSFMSVGTATGVTLNLTAGMHTIQVRATDAAGRSTVATLSLQVQTLGLPFLESRYTLLVLVVAIGASAIAFGVWRNRRRQHAKPR